MLRFFYAYQLQSATFQSVLLGIHKVRICLRPKITLSRVETISKANPFIFRNRSQNYQSCSTMFCCRLIRFSLLKRGSSA